MPTSPDGILTVQFDPATAAVSLLVDGSMWPSAVTHITITRTPTGQASVPVRGVERRAVAGGWYVGSDHEMPLDTDVRYEVTGYDIFGDEVLPEIRNEILDPRLRATVLSTNGATFSDTRPTSGGPNGNSYFRRTMTTANTSSPMSMPLRGAGTSGVPVTPGEVRAGSWHARKSSGGPSTRMDVTWYTAAGATISTSSSAVLEPGATWLRYEHAFTVPPTAAFARPNLVWTGTALAGQLLDFGDAQFEKGAVATPYGDGTRPGWTWQGAADNSASVFLLPRPAVTVSTAGAAWGLWLKAPGRADLTVLAGLKGRGDVSSPTIGGTYQVHEGAEVAAWSGRGGDRITLQIQTRTVAADAALRTLLDSNRVLLIQTGQPADFGDGSGSDWWFVENPSQSNPQGYVPSDDYALRYRTLQLVRTTTPAGEGVVYTGQTYSTVYGEFATYQALLDGTPTYEDLMTGGA